MSQNTFISFEWKVFPDTKSFAILLKFFVWIWKGKRRWGKDSQIKGLISFRIKDLSSMIELMKDQVVITNKQWKITEIGNLCHGIFKSHDNSWWKPGELFWKWAKIIHVEHALVFVHEYIKIKFLRFDLLQDHRWNNIIVIQPYQILWLNWELIQNMVQLEQFVFFRSWFCLQLYKVSFCSILFTH